MAYYDKGSEEIQRIDRMLKAIPNGFLVDIEDLEEIYKQDEL